MKQLILLILMMSVYNPSYAQEYKIEEIEEIAYAFFNSTEH